MRKFIPTLLIGLAVLVTACQGAPVSSPAQATTAASQAPATTEPSPAQPTSPVTQGAQLAAAKCTVVSGLPTPGPTEQSLFPPPGSGDWIMGPDTARITLTEYSDFQ